MKIMNKWIDINRNKINLRDAQAMSKKLSDSRQQSGENFTCPSCNSTVTMKELIERRGSFCCVNCVR